MSIQKLFIDTKKFSDKSKIKIELNDEYIRKYRKSKFYTSKYFISVKQFQMFNQFKNISADKNDRIFIYKLDLLYPLGDDTVELKVGNYTLNESIDDETKPPFSLYKTFRLKEGNPSVSDIVNAFNTDEDMKAINLSVSFNQYNNKFDFQNEGVEDYYLSFNGSGLVYGFDFTTLYRIKCGTEPFGNNFLFGKVSVNVQGDTLILFNLSTDSDISLTKASYDNINKSFFELNNIFYTQPINVLPGDIIQYNRQCHEENEINFDHNSLRQFTIEAYNQDKDRIDMSDFFLELEIIEKKENKFLQLIIILLKYIIQLMI